MMKSQSSDAGTMFKRSKTTHRISILNSARITFNPRKPTEIIPMK